jgi:two-component system chemotaxis response regulator CheB
METRSEPDHALDDRAGRRVAVLGASSGGVEALTSLVQALPADTSLALAVVLHAPSGTTPRVARSLDRAGPLRTMQASHASPMLPGHMYVAPPDVHLVLHEGGMLLRDGPRENGSRPAIDPLFRSAARTLGPSAIGVILSGLMDDGVAGLAAIQSFGGTTIVQDPGDALVPVMPQAALQAIEPDHVLPAAGIGTLLGKLAGGENAHGHRDAQMFAPMALRDPTLIADPSELRTFGISLACPECDAPLREIAAGPLSRFRCRTGHVYSPLSLLEAEGVDLEAALLSSLRGLEEDASIAGRLATRALESGSAVVGRRFEMRQGDAVRRADFVRRAIRHLGAGRPRDQR